MRKLLFSLSITAISLFLSQGAYAASTTTNLTNTATVVAACTLTGTGINFGPLSPTASTLANGALVINCSTGTTFVAFLNNGLNGTTTARRLQRIMGAELINYTLHTASPVTSTNVWGTGTTGGVTCPTTLCAPLTSTTNTGKSGTGTGANQTVTIFGSAGLGTTTPGIYRDTVKAILIF